MKVKILCNLKNTEAGGLISAGTIYEGTEETLPAFVLSELKLNRGTVEILPEVNQKKKRKKSSRSVNKKTVGNSQNEKPTSLREKLVKSEK